MVTEDLMRKYKYGYVHSCKLLEEPFIKDLLKENQELKEKFKATNKGLTNAVLKRKKWKHKYELGRCKIKELKKQLEEKQNPLKGIFAQVNDDTLLRDCGAMQSEIDELKKQLEEINKFIEKCGFANIEQVMLNYCGLLSQQKEFIKYLENQLKLYKEDMNKINAIENPYKWDEWKDIVHEYEVILRKYKEIIGVSDENIIK